MRATPFGKGPNSPFQHLTFDGRAREQATSVYFCQMSDRALITELQEESKMLRLEVSRLTKVKQDTKVEVRELAARLEHATQKCSTPHSPAVADQRPAEGDCYPEGKE
jgi:hypothetical protein